MSSGVVKAASDSIIQIGPSIKLIDVAHPAQLGIEARIYDYIGLSYHKGFLPEIGVDEFNFQLDNHDFGIKIHPFKGSFYLGVLIGKQRVSVQTNQEVSYLGGTTSADITGIISGSYLTPHIGWQWRFKSGFFMGMYVGWQINRGARTNINVIYEDPALQPIVESDPDFQQAREDIIDIGDEYGNMAIPNVGLLQFGWMF